MNDDFWAFQWLDEYGVDSVSAAKKALMDPKAVDRVADYATRATLSHDTLDEFALVAGRGIDLSGHLDCQASSCRTRQVDDLFRGAWHYFDRIVVADAMSHEVTKHWDAPLQDRRRWLLSHIEVLLYLRSLGAEKLVVFREKPTPCELHWDQHAAEAGLSGLFELRRSLVELLEPQASLDVQEVDGRYHFTFVHPRFEHTVWGQFDRLALEGTGPSEIDRAALMAVVKRYLAHLTSDVALMKQVGAPLGAAIWFHHEMLRRHDSSVHPSEVAFELRLPILEKIPIETLLKLRVDERDAFLRFRYKLRQAIRERSRLAAEPNASTLAKEIREDLIDPELEAIRQRLASAARMLQKKTALGLGLGGLVTTCGLMSGLGSTLAIGAGVGTATAITGSAVAKDIEERREAALSDMFFLWKAKEHTGHDA